MTDADSAMRAAIAMGHRSGFLCGAELPPEEVAAVAPAPAEAATEMGANQGAGRVRRSNWSPVINVVCIVVGCTVLAIAEALRSAIAAEMNLGLTLFGLVLIGIGFLGLLARVFS